MAPFTRSQVRDKNLAKLQQEINENPDAFKLLQFPEKSLNLLMTQYRRLGDISCVISSKFTSEVVDFEATGQAVRGRNKVYVIDRGVVSSPLNY